MFILVVPNQQAWISFVVDFGILVGFKGGIDHHILGALVPVFAEFAATHTDDGDFIFYAFTILLGLLCRGARWQRADSLSGLHLQ